MDENDVLSLENICNGAMPEIFRRELTIILANISDVNTPAEKKRAITFKLTFEPFPDREDGALSMANAGGNIGSIRNSGIASSVEPSRSE